MTKQTTNQLVTVQKNLETLLHKKMQALPKNFNQTRFVQNCMVVLQDTKDIQKYDPISVARGLLKGAFLDLDFFNGECYMIPYGNELKFQTDYKGEVKVLKKYSIQKVKDVFAKVVRKGDDFQEIIDGGIQTIKFHPKPFNNSDPVGVFGVCVFADGSMVYDTMSFEQVETIRTTYSKQPNGQAWKNSYGEMMKKTIVRRLKKWIPIEFENSEQHQAYEDGSDVEFEEIQEIKETPKIQEPEETAPEELYDISMALDGYISEHIDRLSSDLIKQVGDWLDIENKNKKHVKSGDALIEQIKKQLEENQDNG